MSNVPPSNVQYTPPPPSPGNGMGTAGFIVSLVGYLACGLLCPIGVVLSVMGLRREPKGLAIAGLIIGILGSIGFIIVFFVIGLGVIVGGIGMAVGLQEARTAAMLYRGQAEIAEYYYAHDSTLPSTREGTAWLVTEMDGDRDEDEIPRYRRIDDRTFELYLPGEDGAWGTDDDRVRTWNISDLSRPGPGGGGGADDGEASSPDGSSGMTDGTY